jgi:hypothetical protein
MHSQHCVMPRFGLFPMCEQPAPSIGPPQRDSVGPPLDSPNATFRRPAFIPIRMVRPNPGRIRPNPAQIAPKRKSAGLPFLEGPPGSSSEIF